MLPEGEIGEAGFVRDVVHEHVSITAAIVLWCERELLLLSRRVPDLQSDVAVVQSYGDAIMFDADCGFVIEV